MDTHNPELRMISRAQLETLLGLSRSTIYDRLSRKSKRYDPTFPQPIKFGRLSRWRLSEVLDWIESKAVLRNQSV
ncbi:helix-turn-helix transcriptional regulator [Acinetobacter towneri]|uniref:helix-turn-helix transcriptional regulator n=1 Tax=Acinetobacter towneri TaxID=202956 RepID=UPI0002D124BB|nr:AlpA family phage regulatory protein [Acinetobacter towneri]ENV70696.1 hypothetical protein F947_00702 [Acinetobacter towneri DSM 14962 = CIP 107472]